MIELATRSGKPRNSYESDREKGLSAGARERRRTLLGYLRQIDRLEQRQALLEWWLNNPWQGRIESHYVPGQEDRLEPVPMWGVRLFVRTWIAEYVHNAHTLERLEKQYNAYKGRQEMPVDSIQSAGETIEEMAETEKVITAYMAAVAKRGFTNGLFTSVVKALRQQG